MNDQHRMDKLTKSKQRLATMKGFSDRNSMFRYLDEPEIIKNVSRYLEDFKPDLSVHRRMMLEDNQRGSGKRSKTYKKRRNRKNRY
jgi:hypothetical protein